LLNYAFKIFRNGDHSGRAVSAPVKAQPSLYRISKAKKSFLDQSGQAMVEFAILLIIIMTLCAGMLYISRLLTLQFWAQQDARLLAFEQTWVPLLGREHGIPNSVLDLDDGEKLRRPKSARGATINRELESNPDTAGMNDIFARLFGFGDSANSPDVMNEEGSSADGSAIMLAKENKSVWTERTDPRMFDSPQIDLVETAYAAQDVDLNVLENDEIQPREMQGVTYPSVRREKRERGLTNLLERSEFGRRLCRRVDLLLEVNKITPPKDYIEKDCAAAFNSEFGKHLATNLDFTEIFRDYALQLEGVQSEGGVGPRVAISNTIQQVIAHELYSFFDQRVKQSFDTAPDHTSNFTTDVSNLLFDNNEYLRLFQLEYLRYVGQLLALTEFGDSLNSLTDWSSSSRDVAGLKQLENDIGDVLFDDATDDFPLPGLNGFWMTAYDIIPIPSLTSVIGPLFDVFATQYLSEESDLIDPLINESVKETEVSYNPTPVTFKPAERRFATGGRNMRGRFYLLTQPWHITRRIHDDADTSYRELGGQLDDKSMNTDEAILRRRVWGMYIVPSQPTDLLNLLSSIMPDDFDTSFIDDSVDALEPVDDVVSAMKEGLLNSKFNDLIDFMNDLSFISMDRFKLPEWPAVRPQAYPDTIEIQDDKLAGEERDFNKFLDEQNQNPKPNPKFN